MILGMSFAVLLSTLNHTLKLFSQMDTTPLNSLTFDKFCNIEILFCWRTYYILHDDYVIYIGALYSS